MDVSSAFPELSERLADPSVHVQAAALELIGSFESEEAQP